MLVLSLGLVGGSASDVVDSLFELFLKIYEPMIAIVLKSGDYPGESSMIAAAIIGLPFGVFCYGLIVGLIGYVISRFRVAKSKR